MTQSFEPPEELVERLAFELYQYYEWAIHPWEKVSPGCAEEWRHSARALLRALGPAIIDAGIRQRVAALDASAFWPIQGVSLGEDGTTRGIVLQADLLRALGVTE